MVVESHLERRHTTLADAIRLAGEVDADGETHGPDVEHVRQTFQAERGLRPRRFKFARTLEQIFLAIQIERGKACGAGQRVRRIGIAVKQFDDVLRTLHEGIVNTLAYQHATHRHATRGHAFGKRDHVGHHAVTLGGEGITQPSKTGDDLVENQQDAVLVANGAQLLQITLGRRNNAGRARHRLDNDGGYGRGIMQRDQAIERVGEMTAPLRLVDGESLFGAIIRRGQMIGADDQRAELFAVVDDTADGDAAKADAMIATLAANQAHPRAAALHVVKRQRDFQRGIDGFRA